MKNLLLASILLILGSCFVPSTLLGSAELEPQIEKTEDPKIEDVIPKNSSEGIALIYFGFSILLICSGVYILVKSGIKLPFVRQE